MSAKARNGKKTEINNNNTYESDSDAESICDQDFERKADVGLLIEADDPSELSENEFKVNRMLLRSPFFPSKIGGKPAWLDYANIPSSALSCESCKCQLTFLVQIYAPISSDDPVLSASVEDADKTFHRTLFVFICSSETCEARTVRALRSQLGYENEFYSTEPPPSPGDDLTAKDVEDVSAHLAEFYTKLHEAKHLNLCAVCGVPSTKRCAKCSVNFYCSQAHQIYDWSKLNHKSHCAKYVALLSETDKLLREVASDENSPDKYSADRCVNYFPEYELSIEPEYLEDVKLAYKAEKALKLDEKKLADDLEKNQGMEQDLDDLKETDQDRDFDKFKKFTEHEPNQVVRYERGGKPLWVTKTGKLKEADSAVPACQNCGTRRIFEFQINPQLLNYLKLDESKNSNTVDWAGLYVYTCPRSCSSADQTYVNEYVYKQDFA